MVLFCLTLTSNPCFWAFRFPLSHSYYFIEIHFHKVVFWSVFRSSWRISRVFLFWSCSVWHQNQTDFCFANLSPPTFFFKKSRRHGKKVHAFIAISKGKDERRASFFIRREGGSSVFFPLPDTRCLINISAQVRPVIVVSEWEEPFAPTHTPPLALAIMSFIHKQTL